MVCLQGRIVLTHEEEKLEIPYHIIIVALKEVVKDVG